MKTIFRSTMAGAALIVLVLVWSCGKDGGGIVDIFIPDIEGNWFNNANDKDKFSFFDVPPKGSATGTFSGNEFDDDIQIGSLTGSFDHSKINFTVTFNDVNIKPITYTGTIAGSPTRTMTLAAPGKKLNLTKQ
ncbi:hypothetical protein SNE25_21520 [Mucilaginibacter sabulilitoris]|uniref:Lipocalin-like domain-containing protein n=1 Tax=Mucilaginibacter sabulilitoris TaxID=1173583 RepID=A0ABZ0TL58_9SPHI|nr:hypothetical protein [Mucilaginibacter sabulilitoris]WPU91900.1 hypothetical protein SNE25_21520 [Mucilaginibacter sabulilitoris]